MANSQKNQGKEINVLILKAQGVNLYTLGLGIARYLSIQLDSLGLHSIQFRFDIDPIRYRFNNTCR